MLVKFVSLFGFVLFSAGLTGEARSAPVRSKGNLVAFTADGKTLAYVVAGTDRNKEGPLTWQEVRLFDVVTRKGRSLYRLSRPANVPGIPPAIRSLAFTADGKTLAFGDVDVGGTGRVTLVDVATGKKRITLESR